MPPSGHEQMNKLKPDDEFAQIDPSDAEGDADAGVAGFEIQFPSEMTEAAVPPCPPCSLGQSAPEDDRRGSDPAPEAPPERHYTIAYGDTGYSYDTIFGPYLRRATAVVVEDPYIRLPHQIANFVRFCKSVVKATTIRQVTLVTSYDPQTDIAGLQEKLDELKLSLMEYDVELDVRLDSKLHDREVRLDNGWTIKIGRGLDFYQRPGGWFAVGASDLSLRRCLETKVDVFVAGAAPL